MFLILILTQTKQSIKDQLLYNKLDYYKAKICNTKYISLDWVNYTKIEAILTIDKNNKNKVELEDIRKKARQLKKKKQYLKQKI